MKLKKNKSLLKALGFDFGLCSIGVAVGQTLSKTSKGIKAIKAVNGVPVWDEIKVLIKEWCPDLFVVGKPLDRNGNEFYLVTLASDKFAQELKKRFLLPTYRVNEHLTTVEAKEQIFSVGGFRALKKDMVDIRSAQLILESWLQMN